MLLQYKMQTLMYVLGKNFFLGWSARIMLKFNHVALSTAYSNILVNQFLLSWPISVLFDQTMSKA